MWSDMSTLMAHGVFIMKVFQWTMTLEAPSSRWVWVYWVIVYWNTPITRPYLVLPPYTDLFIQSWLEFRILSIPCRFWIDFLTENCNNIIFQNIHSTENVIWAIDIKVTKLAPIKWNIDVDTVLHLSCCVHGQK